MTSVVTKCLLGVKSPLRTTLNLLRWGLQYPEEWDTKVDGVVLVKNS